MFTLLSWLSGHCRCHSPGLLQFMVLMSSRLRVGTVIPSSLCYTEVFIRSRPHHSFPTEWYKIDFWLRFVLVCKLQTILRRRYFGHGLSCVLMSVLKCFSVPWYGSGPDVLVYSRPSISSSSGSGPLHPLPTLTHPSRLKDEGSVISDLKESGRTVQGKGSPRYLGRVTRNREGQTSQIFISVLK